MTQSLGPEALFWDLDPVGQPLQLHSNSCHHPGNGDAGGVQRPGKEDPVKGEGCDVGVCQNGPTKQACLNEHLLLKPNWKNS